MAKFFFPANLSPQGWLTDFLLAQSDDQIRDFFNAKSENKMLRDLKGKVFSLHPSTKNKLENIILPSTLSDPSTMWSKNWIDSKRYYSFMRNLSPGQIAAMHPHIKLSLKSANGDERDIRFKTHTDLNTMLSNRFSRGEGAGIKSVNVVRKSPNFGIPNYQYYITVEYFFRSMAIFTRGASDDNRFKGDYIKLIAPSEFLTKGAKESLYLEYGWTIGNNVSNDIIPPALRGVINEQEKKKFELKWQSNDFKFEQTGEVLLSVKYIGIASAKMFKDDADEPEKVLKNNVLQISNVDFLNSLFSEKQFLEIYKANEELILLEKVIKENNKAPSADQIKKKVCNSAQLSQEERERLERIDAKILRRKGTESKALAKRATQLRGQVAKNALNGILSSIEKDGQLFKVFFNTKKKKWYGKDQPEMHKHTVKTVIHKHLNVSDKLEFSSTFEVGKFTEKTVTVVGLTKDAVKKEKSFFVQLDQTLSALTNSEFGTKYPKKSFGNIMFFPLRAAINAVYKSVHPDFAKELPFVCLGNVAYRSLGRTVWTNIGDILVELGTFQRWFFNSSFRKGISEWRVGDFMQEVMQTLVPEVLHDHSTGEYGNTNFGPIKKQEYVLPQSWSKGKTSHGSIPLIVGEKGFLPALRDGNAKTETLLEDVFARDIKRKVLSGEQENTLVYYHQFGSSNQKYNEIVSPMLIPANGEFDRADDEARGQFHLNIGDSAGLLKTIGFSQQDNAALRTALMLEMNKDDSISFLKYAYRSDATLVGNNIFTNAGWFVLPLNPLGIDEADDPGLAGYYRIDELIDSIGPGDYTTIVKGQNLLNNQQIINRRNAAKVIESCPDSSDEQKKKAKKDKKVEEFPIVIEHSIEDYLIDFLMNDKVEKAYGLTITK